MGKIRMVMALTFLLALGSGLVAGMLVMRLPATNAVAETPLRTPLAEELQLTADQNQKMRDIWEGVRGKVDGCFLRAQDMQKRRDKAIFGLLSDQQKIEFARIQQEYTDSLTSLKTERDGVFQTAVTQTEQILSAAQKERYRAVLQSRLGREPGAGAPDWITLQPAPTTNPDAR